MSKEPRKLGEYYYHEKHGTYWLRKSAEKFIEMKDRQLKLWMRWFEIPVDKEDHRTQLKFGDELLLKCQEMRGVEYAGALAGHPVGLRRIGPRSVLITSQVTQIQAVKGSIENFDRFLGELLGDAAIFFLYWLKLARESLIEGDFRPGQMVGLFGESGCGKSFLQTLITAFLGGRMAKPFRYMTGGTQFNSDLAGAEHWVIADEKSSCRLDKRREFGAQIKDATVNPELSVHGKGCEAFTIHTYRRLTVSGNHESENLMILPPLDDSILDKVMLFKCRKARLGKNRKQTWNRFMGEMAALAWHLEHLTIPDRYADDRYGVKAYHDPEVLCAVTAVSPEQRLIDLIDSVLWQNSKESDGSWDGTAMELEKALRNPNAGFQFAVENLLSFSSASGVYLQRLAQKLPERVSKRINGGKTYWRICQPKEADESAKP